MARREDGAALVEAAIVLPILMFLVLSIIEIGGMMKTYSGTASTVRHATRTASLAGADPMADATVLRHVAELTEALDEGEVDLVVIWHPGSSGDALPTGCVPTATTPNTSSVGSVGAPTTGVGACNAYIEPDAPGAAFAMAMGTAAQPREHYFGCTGSTDPAFAHKLDCKWPASTRRVLTSPRASATQTTTDLIGVYVRVRHTSYSGIYDGALTITDDAISLIEPQGYALS